MKKIKRILALALCIMLVFSMASFAFAAETEKGTPNGRVIDGYEPIPLVVIKINFETDGDGKDCYYEKDKNGEALWFDRLYTNTSAQWGEQYCYSPDSYWSEMCFGEGFGSLNDYYKYISNDRFYWIPAEETSGTANDGVITVTINAKHPGADDKEGLKDGGERAKALAAADEFIDFSKYDKDGSGQLDFTELSVVFIYGGMEISYGSPVGSMYSYSTHAHVSHISYTNTHDGVKLWSDLPYVRMGESSNGNGGWSKMGKLAHELGHVLGAKDLYMSDGRTWIGGCGQLSLMGGGSSGMNGNVSSPTVLDPYYKVLYGFADEIIAKSGTQEYTLYSHESTEGEFKVIRVNISETEYLLIENRSHSSDKGYDNNGLNGDDDKGNGKSMQGILIWHIDQESIDGYARPNNGDEGHPAGLTIIHPNGIGDANNNSTWSKDQGGTFVASNEATYKFPVSKPSTNPGTWHTTLTEEEAAACNIKIEFLTSAGNEMKIRITGAKDLAPIIRGTVTEATQNKLSLKADVTDFNGAEVLACKMRISKNENLSGATEITVEKNAAGEYVGTFDNLEPNTEYFYEIELETTHGSAKRVSSKFTNPVPVEKTKATVTVVLNSDRGSKTSVKTDIGKAVVVNEAYLVKKGYTFDGWYLDEAFTEPFDITKPLESADDFTIYAKWVQGSSANNTTAKPSTPDNNENTPGNNQTGEAPNGGAQGGNGGNTMTVVVIVVATVAVVGGAAVAAVVVVNKKKTK